LTSCPVYGIYFVIREVDMKKLLALSVFLFVCASAVFAIHPLIGKWKFSYVIDDTRFYDYITIKIVDTTTKRVAGYKTKYPSEKLTGYYNGDNVFIINDFGWTRWWVPINGYYFTFKGETPLKKYLSIWINAYDSYYAEWRGLSTTKLSSSTAPTASDEIMTLSDILNQNALKTQALLRERMTVCASASVSSAAVNPLIGKWKLSYILDGDRFDDYLTITRVNTTTKRVTGYNTKYPKDRFAGYYNGDNVFIINDPDDAVGEYYLNGYYFTFKGKTPLKRYLYIGNMSGNYFVEWRGLSTTKLSSSTAPTASDEIMTLSDVLNQNALKTQALLRERMTARTLLE
jgi:hypothetical protein